MYPIYVLIALLPPVAMLIVGIWWKVSPPKMEGKGLAYRTQLSTKSPEAWAFAHKHCARLWVRMGVILTAAAGIAMYLLRDQDYQTFLIWILAGEMALFCVSAFLVDALLKANFGEEVRSGPSGIAGRAFFVYEDRQTWANTAAILVW